MDAEILNRSQAKSFVRSIRLSIARQQTRLTISLVDRVFLIAPIVPGLNLTPAKENQLGGAPLENSGAFSAQAAA